MRARRTGATSVRTDQGEKPLTHGRAGTLAWPTNKLCSWRLARARGCLSSAAPAGSHLRSTKLGAARRVVEANNSKLDQRTKALDDTCRHCLCLQLSRTTDLGRTEQRPRGVFPVPRVRRASTCTFRSSTRAPGRCGVAGESTSDGGGRRDQTTAGVVKSVEHRAGGDADHAGQRWGVPPAPRAPRAGVAGRGGRVLVLISTSWPKGWANWALDLAP